MRNNTLPKIITAHDLLKTFAVFIMVIDHVGYYFFPENLWWRAIGRIGFPIWFYLVGYAQGRDIPLTLWGGAILLLVMNFVVGSSLLPLNALFTIIMLRLILDSVMVKVKEQPAFFWPLTVMMALLVIPASMVTEYGTQALMFAVFGYLVRHREDLPFRNYIVPAYMFFIAAVFLVYQGVIFAFSPAENGLMAMGTGAVCFVLLNFKAAAYPWLEGKLPNVIRSTLYFCGHRTLEIYVVHLILFKILALFLQMPGYSLFTFHITQ